MRLLAMLALAASLSHPAYAADVGQPIGFTGFVFDPITEMARDGVRVVIAKVVQQDGTTAIAVRVYDLAHDAFGDDFWQERANLCPAPQQAVTFPVLTPEPHSMILFDRFHPPEQKDGDSEEQQ